MGVCCPNNQAGFTSRLLGPICRRRIAPERRGGPACGSAPGCQCFSRPTLTRICLRVEQGQAVNLCSVRVEWCVKTYRLGPSPATHSTPLSQFRSRVASLSHGGRGERAEGEPTCGGGFLPLPEEEDENISGADDSGQEEQGTPCYTIQLMVAVGSQSVRSCILPM